ncbi:MAG: exostosin family protein [Thermoplasmata archaeon]|nr:exostosin family protein [Thermoplasmata archaeon]
MVPEVFLTKDRTPYPRHQTGLGLEDRAEEYFRNQKDAKIKRIFFPIKWTAYQIEANYGHDERKMTKLRSYCKGIFANGNKFFTVKQASLDKYFTIAQYDDGPLVEMGKNCRIFGAGGIGTDPIPLTTERHKEHGFRKEILASFLGSEGTHPIRKQMFDALKKEDLFIVEDVYTKRDNTPHFAEVTEKSCFTLCPRGYGKTSFRLYEAMQLGSVPVYISDVHWLPYTQFVNWNKFCVLVKPEEIKDLSKRLRVLYASGEYKVMAEAAKKVYEEYFCFESMFKWILKILQDEK